MLLAALRNLTASRINRDLMGFELEERIGPINLDEVVAYARATRDEHLPSAGQPFVPPFYVSRLVFPLFRRMLVKPGLRLNLLRAVHGEMRIRWLEPVRTGQNLKVVVRIADVEDTAAGELLHLDGALSADDRKLVEARIGMLVRKRKRGKKKQPKSESQPPVRFARSIVTEEGQQLEYARASGDHNFIHTSEWLARLAGLPRTILHGMCVMAMSYNALNSELPEQARAIRSMQVRFRKPVLPGQTLELRAYDSDQADSLPFAVFNEKGQAVITQGHCELGPPAP
jgi:acyl dehydratase